MNAKQINWPRSRQMLLAAGLVASCLASAAELGSPVAFNAVSPDGLNELRLDVGGKWMEYSIWRRGKAIVEPTPISLEIDGHWDLHDNGAQPKIVKLVKFGKTTEVSRGAVLNGARCTPKVTTRKVDGTLATPLYKKSAINLAANETRVDFGGWAVRLAARDDGVAWRFETELGGEITVNAESTNIRFPKETELCYTVAGGLMSGWERPARIGSVESVPAGHPQIVMTPFTATVPGAGLVTVTESDLRDYPGLNFYRRGNEPDTLRSWQAGVPKELDKGRRRIKVASREPYLAKTKGTRTFPWRVFVLGDTPSALVASDAVYALAAPNSPNPNSPTPNFSWVKPGQVAWDWWNGRRITDVPGLVSGCNYETYKAYIDFAAENGIAYVILDEGWAEKLNLERPRDEVDVPGVIAYGKAKGVGVILWAACPSLFDPGTRHRVFDRYAAMGAKGFKIDFIERDDQEAERFLEEAAADAAERHLVVLYHGIHKPTGLQRTYPNILNYEGVYGLEQGGSIGGRKVVVSNDVNLVYTRMVAGFMDYTPGAMRNRAFDAPPFDAEKDIRACYGTRCHQLALFPLFEAPIQMLCDSPTQYRTAPECTSFITKVPTVWDETVGIAGEIGKYASVARRKGGEWWLGAITDWEARELEVPTDFLGEGEWKVEAFEDAPDADVNAEHYVRRVFTVKAGEPLKVRLASGGGFAARLVPAVGAAPATEVKVYPQSFEAGGWGLDAQFMDVMGSPYLIAHGLGVRVLDAKARVEFPEAGEYRVWVRTKNWADGAPGRFRVLVNGKPLDKEFGAGPREWAWEDGGVVTVEKGEASVALNDLTGFDGRCAGIVFASGGEKPVGPLKVDEANVAETVNADFVVVGGGMPGTCAAVAAARRGLKVALVQDRPVLGGNASGEIRVYCAGEAKHPLVRELRNYFMNRDLNMPWCDARRMRIVEDEKNIDLHLSTRAFGVEKNANGTIAAVKALDLKSNRVVRFEAPLFCDATGDGWVGFWAGADWRMGREAQDEFGESRAPEKPDGDTFGASIMWTSADANMDVPFSAPFAEPHAQGIVAVNGEWRWEYGIHRDMIAEAEEIRDRMLLAIYGAFSLAKKRPENANKVLSFCPYLIGKRESRRIMGDWILSQNDVAANKEFEDAIATGTWGIDLHYDGYKPGVDFLSRNTFDQHGRFWIPYRSIYSRNVCNLFVVGRCFSCTHVGLGAPRVISTLSQLGVAAGEAAAMCRELGEMPRGIYANGHVRKLQEILGGGFPGVPDRETADWLIVDDESDGVKFGRGWRMFRNTNGGHLGLCSHSANAKGEKAQPATYPLPVAEARRYALMGKGPYMWNAKPGSSTAMEVVSGGRTTAFTADQAQSTGQWVKLGEFDLEPGAMLTIIPAKSKGHVVADGFALIPVRNK